MVTSGDVFCCHNLRGVGAPGMCWVEARDDAEHPTMDGMGQPSQQRIQPKTSMMLRLKNPALQR